ncbi:MAG: hypothetical protein ACON4T_06200 [Synechococcus sp.]
MRSDLWWLPALLVLQACGSAPLGQELAESFDQPTSVQPSDQTPSQSPGLSGSTPPPPETDQPVTAAPAVAAGETIAPRETTSPLVDSASLASVAPKARLRPQPSHPYRITIRLSAADPSAPAEVVTRSLREAGIGFEVETIERIPSPNSSSNSSSNSLRVTPEPRGGNR